MNILLVVESKHLGNTLKIAQSMAEVVPVTIVDTKKAKELDMKDYDIVGFGSGIYAAKHDKRILKFAQDLSVNEAYTFVISTSGGEDYDDNNKALIDILKKKNKTILGVFSCKALDKFFVLRFTGGINKGLPNENDYKNAQDFIQNVIEDYKNTICKSN